MSPRAGEATGSPWLVVAAVAVHWLWMPAWIEICRDGIRGLAWYSYPLALVLGVSAALPLVGGVLLASQELRRTATRREARRCNRALRAVALTYAGGLAGLTAVPCLGVRSHAQAYTVLVSAILLTWLAAWRPRFRRLTLASLRAGALAGGVLLAASVGFVHLAPWRHWDTPYLRDTLACCASAGLCLLVAWRLESGGHLRYVRYGEPVSSVP